MHSIKKLNNLIVLALVGLLGIVTLLIVANRADANYTPIGSVPKLSYQGRLVDPETGENMPDGTYTMVFKLYNSLSSPVASAIDSETKSVIVTNGIFAVDLDFADNLHTLKLGSFGEEGMDIGERYLGVAVQGDPEMAPRQKLQFAPYAVAAIDSVTVGGRKINELMLKSELKEYTMGCTLYLTNMSDFTGSSSTSLIPLKYDRGWGSSCPNNLVVDPSGSIYFSGVTSTASRPVQMTVTASYTAIPAPGGFMEIQIGGGGSGNTALAAGAAGPTASGSYTTVTASYTGDGSGVTVYARPSGILSSSLGNNAFHTLSINITVLGPR